MDVVEAGQWLFTLLLPTLAIGACLSLPRAVRTVRCWLRTAAADPSLQVSHPPIEQLAADLRRLLRRYDATRRSGDVAVRARHLRAIEAAIGDCAGDAARALGLSHPDRTHRGGLPRPELRRTLLALADAGLVLVPTSGLFVADSDV